jgi:hypothetical protein
VAQCHNCARVICHNATSIRPHTENGTSTFPHFKSSTKTRPLQVVSGIAMQYHRPLNEMSRQVCFLNDSFRLYRYYLPSRFPSVGTL